MLNTLSVLFVLYYSCYFRIFYFLNIKIKKTKQGLSNNTKNKHLVYSWVINYILITTKNSNVLRKRNKTVKLFLKAHKSLC